MAKPDNTPVIEAMLNGPVTKETEDLKRQWLELQIQKTKQEMDLLQRDTAFREKQALVAEIQIRKDEEEKRRKADELAQARKMQEEGAKSSLLHMRMEEARQSKCRHTNPESGKTNLVALRHHDGTFTLNCGTCGMTTANKTRTELLMEFGDQFPRDENIAGPLPPGSYLGTVVM